MISAAFYHALSGPEKWRKGNGLRPRGGGGGAVSSLHNLPHLWGRGTAIAVEGVLAKAALTVYHQYPQPLRGHPPTRGKRLTAFSVACGSLRTPFACHPNGVGLAD